MQYAFDELGNAGWELVTSVTTVKTLVWISGNDLVFVFKKRGAGHKPPDGLVGPRLLPMGEQIDYLRQLLAWKGMDETEIRSVEASIKRNRHTWTDVGLTELNNTLYPMTVDDARSHLEWLARGAAPR